SGKSGSSKSASSKSEPKANTKASGSGGTCKASYYWQDQMTATGERFNVAAGFAVTPSAEDEQTQFIQNAAPAADAPDTSAANKAAKDAEKQQKDSAPSLTVKEEEPAEDAETASNDG
ncbi:hypothetical protein, partial [Brevibacterium paucivorans]